MSQPPKHFREAKCQRREGNTSQCSNGSVLSFFQLLVPTTRHQQILKEMHTLAVNINSSYVANTSIQSELVHVQNHSYSGYDNSPLFNTAPERYHGFSLLFQTKIKSQKKNICPYLHRCREDLWQNSC